MSDRFINLDAVRVRALLDGRVSQVRRILKPQPPEWATFCQQPSMLNVEHRWVPSGLWRWSEPEKSPPRRLRQWPVDEAGQHYWLRPPYSKLDRLWVRESFVRYHDLDGDDRPAGELMTCYRANGWPCSGWYDADREETRDAPPWRSSSQMPRSLSRLTLIVTEVRVERLQDISEADAKAEGYRAFGPDIACPYQDGPTGDAVDAFALGWVDLHGRGTWVANPWVAAITFTTHRANIDALDVEPTPTTPQRGREAL